MPQPQYAATADPVLRAAPWADTVLDVRADPEPYPDVLPAPWWAVIAASGRMMSAHVIPRGRGSDTVLLLSGADGEPNAALVVYKVSGQYVAVGHLGSVLYGLKPVFDRLASLLLDHTTAPCLAHTEVPDDLRHLDTVHAVLTDPDTPALAARVGWYVVADCASHSLRDPALVQTMASVGLSGASLAAWPNYGWPLDANTAAWACVFPHPGRAESWAMAGFSAADAAPFAKAGMHSPRTVHEWRDQGWSDADIATWGFAINTDTARKWQATRMSGQAAKHWHEWGHFTPEQARLARVCGVKVVEAHALLATLADDPDRLPAEDLDAAYEVSAYLSLLVRDQGADLPTVHAYLRAGITSTEAATRYVADTDDAQSLAVMAALRGKDETWEDAVFRARSQVHRF